MMNTLHGTTRNAGKTITPVILAGGMGTRLRPLTSDSRPKPFLKLFSKYSLFQETVRRCAFSAPPVIVCHQSYLPMIRAHLAQINVVPRAIILEPEHKGTAAAIALAAFYLKNKGEYMLVLPSDHVMREGDAFQRAVASAVPNAQESIVMLGAMPNRAETGYGYIEFKGKLGEVNAIRSFKEKPEKTAAKAFLQSGQYLWNTGMFVSRPRIFLNTLKQHEADLHKCVERSFYAGEGSGDVYLPHGESFSRILPISVDYAVMEHMKNSMVCYFDAPWSDAGTWRQLSRLTACKIKRFVK